MPWRLLRWFCCGGERNRRDKDEGKDVGTVYIGFAGRGRESTALLFRYSSWGRASIRRKAATTALLLLSAYIDGADIKQIAESWNYI